MGNQVNYSTLLLDKYYEFKKKNCTVESSIVRACDHVSKVTDIPSIKLQKVLKQHFEVRKNRNKAIEFLTKRTY